MRDYTGWAKVMPCTVSPLLAVHVLQVHGKQRGTDGPSSWLDSNVVNYEHLAASVRFYLPLTSPCVPTDVEFCLHTVIPPMSWALKCEQPEAG